MNPKSQEYTAESFSRTLLRLQNSRTYAVFCEKVYGLNLRQFNAVDDEQFQKLLCSLNINERHRVLDLGCGGGFICEHISDLTGANVTGIDFAESIIGSAQDRIQNKKHCLQFQTEDMNNLPHDIGKFDFVISIDTLYFVDDLSEVLKRSKRLLNPGGTFAAFYTYKRKEGDLGNRLKPDSNRLGKALLNAGFEFQAFDFSANERSIWENTLKFAEDLRESFKEEGYFEIYEERVREAERNLKSINGNCSARALYLAKSSN